MPKKRNAWAAASPGANESRPTTNPRLPQPAIPTQPRTRPAHRPLSSDPGEASRASRNRNLRNHWSLTSRPIRKRGWVHVSA